FRPTNRTTDGGFLLGHPSLQGASFISYSYERGLMTTSIHSPLCWPVYRSPEGAGVSRCGSLLLLVLLLLSGCQTRPPSTGHNIRFHMEVAEGAAMRTGAIPMRLPF